MPRVTIVIRTRDRGILLARALRSVASQTFTDYEVVIVNDGGEPQVVTDVIAQAPQPIAQRVRRVDNEHSHGREAAVEDGLDGSTAEYFTIHDDDDSWEPDFLTQCVAYLDAHQDCGAVATRCDVIYEHLEGDDIVEDSREVVAPERERWSLLDTLVGNFVPPISQLIRRSAADQVGHWDGRFETQADWDFNLRMMAAHPVGFLPDTVLAHWHQRPAQMSALGNSVVDHAAQHVRDNLAIRDMYIRQGAGDHLGQMLLEAELFKRMQDLTNGHARHRAEQLNTILENQRRLAEALDNLSQRVDAIHDRLGRMEQAQYQYSVRGTAVRTLQKCQPAYRSAKALRDRLRRSPH